MHTAKFATETLFITFPMFCCKLQRSIGKSDLEDWRVAFTRLLTSSIGTTLRPRQWLALLKQRQQISCATVKHHRHVC